MPDGGDALLVEVARRLADVPAADWDACAGEDNPFVSHAFLSALEESGAVTPETGWMPQHLLLRDAAGTLLACAPFYVKGHSHGEYIFDYSWADAYERAGGTYYPKLLSAVPFTPVTGPRFLLRAGTDPSVGMTALANGAQQLAQKYQLSGLHLNFLPEDQARTLEGLGFSLRYGHQFHWHNRGYGSFDDFLADLSSRKRKMIRKERRRVAESGLELLCLSGDEIEERHWDDFFRFYVDTYDRKWGSPYLNRNTFRLLHDSMREQIVLVMAYHGGRAVAGALNLRGRDAIFGRNWGCVEDFNFLHFEACYYKAIEYAIDHGLSRVEAGTQGEHKLQRGYLPLRTYSAHWFRDSGFQSAVNRFLEQECEMTDRMIDRLAEHSPFRQPDDS